MLKFCKFAIIAAMALANVELVQAQDFSQFSAGPAPKLDGVAKAVYTSLSDMEGSKYDAKQVAFESIRDGAQQGAVAKISDTGISRIPAAGVTGQVSDLATDVGAGRISQTSLFGPSCGAAGPACGLPGPSCGVAGPACGLPGPSCGLAEPACGLPSLGASCGLPNILGGGPSCGAAGGCDGCDSCGSQLQCGSLCTRQCPSCCGVGTHYSFIYGEALYLRARKSEVAYAVPTDGPISPGQIPIQVGNVGVLESDYDLGFRAGVNIALDTVSSLDIRYTRWDNDEHGEAEAVAPFALRSLVSHPSTASAAVDSLAAKVSSRTELELIDASYRHLLKCCDVFSANYVIGGRYANLDQGFDAEFIKNGTESIWTDIDFEGAGLRLGLETERYSCRNQLHVYANGYASFLAGRFRAHYFQGQSFDPNVVDTEWEAGRIVPVIDLEAGVGWTSMSGKWRVNAGYMVSAWFNTVITQDYINAIQTNNFLDLSDTMWFDGLQARVSYRF